MDALIALLASVIGYLLGSVSFARVVTRQFAPEQDISSIEVEVPDSEDKFRSNAISATSVRLHLGNKYGCLVGILDILKATVPALALKLWQPDAPYYLFAAGMAAVGHNWPIYHRFKGGRGISPIMGGMVVVDWLGVVITNLIGFASDLVIKNPLLSSGFRLVPMLPWIWFRHGWPERVYALVMCVIYSVAMVPEWREILRLKREGKLETLQSAKEVKVASRLNGGTAQQLTVSDLPSEIISRLKRKKDGP